MADELTALWELRDSKNADGVGIDGRTADDGMDNRKRPALAQPVQVTQEGTSNAHDNIGQDGVGFGEGGAAAVEDTATILRRSARRVIPSEKAAAATITKTTTGQNEQATMLVQQQQNTAAGGLGQGATGLATPLPQTGGATSTATAPTGIGGIPVKVGGTTAAMPTMYLHQAITKKTLIYILILILLLSMYVQWKIDCCSNTMTKNNNSHSSSIKPNDATSTNRKSKTVHETSPLPPPDNCSCKVTSKLLPPYKQNPFLEYGTGARILFLLGYPYTGTSAVHYLLGTSRNVSTLTRQNDVLGPKQEGWSILGLRQKFKDRWSGHLHLVEEGLNFTNLAEQYWQMWDTEKPLLLENSPPEIQSPQALMDAFSIHGKVRFVLLVRGDCTSHNKIPYHTKNSRVLGYRNVETMFPKDTFVLRYEDLCLRWKDVYDELVRWEPLLVDVDIASIPQAGDGGGQHSHEALSIADYCHGKRHSWEHGLKNTCHRNCTKDWCELSALYGYDEIDSQSCI